MSLGRTRDSYTIFWNPNTCELSIPMGTTSAEPVDLAAYGERVLVHVGERAHVVLFDVLSHCNALVQRTIVLEAQSYVRYQLCLKPECVQEQQLNGQKLSVSVQVVLHGQRAHFEGFVRVYSVHEDDLAIELVQEHEASNTRSLFDVKQVCVSGERNSVCGVIEVGQLADYARAEQRICCIVLEPDLAPLAAHSSSTVSGGEVSSAQLGISDGSCHPEMFFLLMRPTLRVANNTAMVKHGGAVGQLDRDHLFYLQARGMPLERAERLLIEGLLAWP